MQSLLQTIKTLSEVYIEDAFPRNIEAAAVPAAFAETLCGWSKEETTAFMFLCIQNHSSQKSMRNLKDHENLLQTILCQVIRITNYELSVTQALQAIADTTNYRYDYNEIKDALERNGLKITKHNDHRVVFFETEIVRATLLKNTEWKNTNIPQLLERIEGAEKILARFNRKRIWDISIPLDSIIDTKHPDQDDDLQIF
jgi:hypothetical protein